MLQAALNKDSPNGSEHLKHKCSTYTPLEHFQDCVVPSPRISAHPESLEQQHHQHKQQPVVEEEEEGDGSTAALPCIPESSEASMQKSELEGEEGRRGQRAYKQFVEATGGRLEEVCVPSWTKSMCKAYATAIP